MTTASPSLRALALAAGGLCLATLAACGGVGLDGGSVSSVSAASPMYGRSMIVTVSGQQLDRTLYIEGDGCENVALIGGDTSALRFSCVVRKTGAMTLRVRNDQHDRLASLELEVPVPQVRFETSLGAFVVELDPGRAPATVDNFLAYAGTTTDTSFYTNVIFHRVIKDFVVQAGGYAKDMVVKAPTRDPIALESNNGLSNVRASVAMARSSEPASATSQFYVNVQDNPALDYVDEASPGYAVFGHVVEGMETVDAIQAVTTTTKADSAGATLDDVPLTEIVITSGLQVR